MHSTLTKGPTRSAQSPSVADGHHAPAAGPISKTGEVQHAQQDAAHAVAIVQSSIRRTRAICGRHSERASSSPPRAGRAPDWSCCVQTLDHESVTSAPGRSGRSTSLISPDLERARRRARCRAEPSVGQTHTPRPERTAHVCGAPRAKAASIKSTATAAAIPQPDVPYACTGWLPMTPVRVVGSCQCEHGGGARSDHSNDSVGAVSP